MLAAVTSCSTPGAGAEANASCDSPGVTADEVKIGFMFSNSGTGSEALSSARAGLDARIGLANAAGGVNGRTIVYDWRDDQTSAAANERAAEDLVQHSGVFGLVTVTSSNGETPEKLKQAGIPVVGLAQPGYGQYPNWFTNLYEASPETIGRYLRSRNGHKVAIVTTGSSTYVQEFA
ncbi:ABC transporter substrate-binding protein, partial [Frankia sp. EI5c]|uniref:ABC transporter substrate-binding protein n=1 Tax=Frankia sp. EI5c TaxID=683316 RepID=UPI0028C48FB4